MYAGFIASSNWRGGPLEATQQSDNKEVQMPNPNGGLTRRELHEAKAKMRGSNRVEANPLPPELVEGDSADTEVDDDNDTPPGVDPRAAA